ncbi:hypothetical protein INR49_011815 [Caranx melampygus]|nr:hypothetical protein INR49_011815 [Caranx melampygus]
MSHLYKDEPSLSSLSDEAASHCHSGVTAKTILCAYLCGLCMFTALLLIFMYFSRCKEKLYFSELQRCVCLKPKKKKEQKRIPGGHQNMMWASYKVVCVPGELQTSRCPL